MRTSVYIDAAGLFHSSQRQYQRSIDYRLLTKWLKDRWVPDEVRTYCTFRADNAQNYPAFLQLLHDLGHSTQFALRDRYRSRVSWVAQIVIDVMTDRSEHLVFLTSDYDLIDLYKYLGSKHKQVTVVAPRVGLAIQHVVTEYYTLLADLTQDENADRILFET